MRISNLPPPLFRVGVDQDVYKSQTIVSKISRVAYLIFSIAIIPVGIARLIGKALNYYFTKNNLLPALKSKENDKKILDVKREAFLALPGMADRSRRMIMERADGVKIDTFAIDHPEEMKKPPQDRKWIVYFNGNSEAYERNLDNLLTFSNELKANVITCNYAGIGYSEGRSADVKHCGMDGEALVQYLLSLKVQRKNILIYGYSWGGGVGAEVAAHHQLENDAMHLVSDRSFAYLPDIVKITPRYNFRSLLLAKIIGGIGGPLTKKIGWGFDSVDRYRKIKGTKLIIYSKSDLRIPYKVSLYKYLKKQENSNLEKKPENRLKRKKHVEIWKPERLKITQKDIPDEKIHGIPINKTIHFDALKEHVQRAFGRR